MLKSWGSRGGVGLVGGLGELMTDGLEQHSGWKRFKWAVVFFVLDSPCSQQHPVLYVNGKYPPRTTKSLVT